MKTWMMIAAAVGLYYVLKRGQSAQVAVDKVEQGIPRDGANWVTDQWRMLSALDLFVGQDSASSSPNAHPCSCDTAAALGHVYR